MTLAQRFAGGPIGASPNRARRQQPPALPSSRPGPTSAPVPRDGPPTPMHLRDSLTTALREALAAVGVDAPAEVHL
ncbi:MAG: hypothetical protein ACKO04_12960, partial [Actinomycetes bacterium]